MVVMTEPATQVKTWPANVIRVTCNGCGKHMFNIVPKTDAPIQGVVFRHCKCGHYNVQDLSDRIMP